MKNNPTNLEEYKRLLWKYIVVVACVSLIVTASVLQCYNSELTLVCSLIIINLVTCVLPLEYMLQSVLGTRQFAVLTPNNVCGYNGVMTGITSS